MRLASSTHGDEQVEHSIFISYLLNNCFMKSLKFIIFIIFLLLISVSAISKKFRYNINEYIIQPIVGITKPTIKITTINHLGPKVPAIIADILKEKYRLLIVSPKEDYDIIVDSVYSRETIKDKEGIKIFYTNEAALPAFNDYDLITGFNHIDHPKYLRGAYYYGNISKINGTEPSIRSKYTECSARKKYFACFLVSNGFTGANPYNGKILDGVIARDSIFQKLSSYKRVESGGKHLNNIGKIIPYKETPEWLSQCKFTIAYENQSYDGYITEKVFQAYFAGTVPIYYGDKTAVSDINKKAVIYANDFEKEDALVEYIKKVDNDDELYCNIWKQDIMTPEQKKYVNTIYPELREKLFKILEEKLPKK